MQEFRSATIQPISDCFDRININEVKKRFERLNKDRLRRTRAALNHRQDIFLDALPMLFHCNHPMLPGFVSHSTPAGISGYKPSKTDIANGKALARSFCLTGGHANDDIWSLFLMGSSGTLAQSSSSDFDIWVCHKPGLSKPAIAELEQKCKRITQWADTLKVDAHCFLMDSDAFRSGTTLSLDEESSGSAQRFLLLDEFYRTGLHLAGRTPLWWYTPSEKEGDYKNYSGELIDKRFIRQGLTLDFGGTSCIPPGEFVGAGIWQLYKAISSPFKSVLKLLLLESYACDYPNIRPLSLEFKQHVYDGELDIDEMDPYLMVYRRIEKYLLQTKDFERLELARRCFYFKVNKPLSKPASKLGTTWQRLAMEDLVSEWGWTNDYIEMIDSRSEWKALQVKEERNLLVHALNSSYEFLQNFAQETGASRAISSTELNVLGRKLQAAFERRPDKLDWINPGISKDISETVLTLHQSSLQDGEVSRSVWQLTGSETGSDTPLRQSNSPVELLLWAYINNIVASHTRFDLSQQKVLNENQVKRVITKFRQWLPLPLAAASHDTFKRAAAPTQVLLLINTGYEPESDLAEKGVQRLSDNADALRYGSVEENLVTSIDMVEFNSWQEVSSHHFHGSGALLAALKAYMSLCMPGSHQAPPVLTIECIGQVHGSLITQRIKQWFHEVSNCYYSGTKPASTRYLMQLRDIYCCLQFKGPRLVTTEHDSFESLLKHLGEKQRRYSPIVVDSYALHNHPLKLIARVASARAIHVFYQHHEHHLSIYVVDEKGSVVLTECENTPKLSSLGALHCFLRNVLKRIQENDNTQAQLEQFGVQPIEFHEIREDSRHQLALLPKTVAPEINPSLTQLEAVVRSDNSGHYQYDFFCMEQSFLWELLGRDVFWAAAQFILRQRSARERYPIFLTDLNLVSNKMDDPSKSKLQLSHYLRIKAEMERRLSSSINALR